MSMRELAKRHDSEEAFHQHVYDKPYLFDNDPELLAEVTKALKPEFTIFEGIKERNRFWSGHSKEYGDERLLANGTMAYRIIGYAKSPGEAQLKLYGRTSPLDDSEPIYDNTKQIPSNIA